MQLKYNYEVQNLGSVRRNIMSKPMTKTQLVAALADEMGSDKKSANAALDAVCNLSLIHI